MNSDRSAFTDKDHAYIKTWLPRKGYRYVADKLGRDPKTTWAYADRHGIRFGEIPSWVRASDVAKLTQDQNGNVIRKADRAGVSRRVGPPNAGPRATLVLVKKKWADELIERMQRKRENDSARDAGYLTTRECEELWSLGSGTVKRGFAGKGFLAGYLEGARIVRGVGGHGKGAYLINPHDAARVRKELDQQRELAKTLISTKSIGIDYDIEQHYAADLGRQEGGRILLAGGRLCCFLTEEQAARVKDRLSGDPTKEPPAGWVATTDIAKETDMHPSAVISWMQAKKRDVSMRKYRHPISHLMTWWVPLEWLEAYRAFRAERDAPKEVLA